MLPPIDMNAIELRMSQEFDIEQWRRVLNAPDTDIDRAALVDLLLSAIAAQMRLQNTVAWLTSELSKLS